MASFNGTIRGTTPTFIINLPFNTSTLTNCEMYFAQEDELLVTKSLEDFEADGTTLTISLTQADTLLFSDDEKLQIQLRFLFTDGSVEATTIMKKKVGEILKDGEISE